MANNRMRTPRRRKSWFAMPSQTSNLTSSGTQIVSGSLNFAESGQTILRSQVDVLFRFTQGATFAASDAAKIAFGLAVVSTDAFEAGSGSMPDPAGEAEYSWLYWREIHMTTGEGTAMLPDAITQVFRDRWDTKAMRKIQARQSMVWVAQYVDISGAPAITLSFGQTRVLLALH